MYKKLLMPIVAFPCLALAAPPAFAATSAGPETFAGSYTLWIAIVIGFIASFVCFRYALELKGSATSVILKFFGAGMFFVVLGFLSVATAWAQPSTQKIVHDLLFIAGNILMLVGARRVKKLGV